MITTDITPAFRKAVSRQSAWTLDLFQEMLQRLSKLVEGSVVDWDCGAGENWGRVIQSSQVVGIMCLRCPLVFLKHGVFASTTSIEGVETLFVSRMDEQVYSVKRNVLEELVGRAVSDNWDPAKCSVEDIWWATAT